MKRRLILLSLFLWIFSCDNSEYQGFKHFKNGVYVKMLALGDEDRPCAEGDFISFRIEAITTTDTPLVIKDFHQIPISDISGSPAFKDVLIGANEEDSLLLEGAAGELGLDLLFSPDLFAQADKVFKLKVSILRVLNDAELREIRAQQRLLEDREMLEQSDLATLIDSFELTDEHFVEGIYVKHNKLGKGKRVKTGAQVTVHYIGSFVDGRTFENTYLGNPLVFQSGKPDQVLVGFATGLARMKEGGEATFVIPSAYGFGDKGSSSGIVPPYATLIYQVKLVKVEV